jgi:hypothetical protein
VGEVKVGQEGWEGDDSSNEAFRISKYIVRRAEEEERKGTNPSHSHT